jgi:hypothetical protein
MPDSPVEIEGILGNIDVYRPTGSYNAVALRTDL